MDNIKDKAHLRKSLFAAFIITSSIWFVRGIELINNHSFSHFGLKPRSIKGMVGIFTSPFIHNYNSLNHLWSNTLPLFVLSSLVIYLFNKIAVKVILGIWIIMGIWVWCLAQSGSYHIGASGVVYGLLAFLLFSGVWRRNKAGIALSMLLIISYGAMFWGLFPIKEGISWESHLMGFIAGITLSIYYKDIRMYGHPSKEQVIYSPISFSYGTSLNYVVHFVSKNNDSHKVKTLNQPKNIGYEVTKN